ncbi:MAG: MarR family winged helix-turn-helix transcriptional regulator [Syntrophales bacterium]
MREQSRELAELIKEIVFCFGTYGMEEEYCGDISHAECRALRAALHHENCTMQEVAKSAVVTKSGATRIVTRLEDKGLVRRERDPEDGRICCVTLTKKGKKFLAGIEEQLKNDMELILGEMDPAMRSVLIISLNAFLKIAHTKNAGCGKNACRSGNRELPDDR